MTQQVQSTSQTEIIYPDSDGEPMAENTEHFERIVSIKKNLDILFAQAENVFVAGDLLWYPVQGSLSRQAPDVMVVFGRPKGYRGSYKQWEEGGIAPQVVFEIRSPGNREADMLKKLLFYQVYGVEEYYLYDTTTQELMIFMRQEDLLQPVESIAGWVSPRLQVRMEVEAEGLQLYFPDGRRFLSYEELNQELETQRQRAEAERQRAEAERQRAEAEQQRAEAEQQRAEAEQQRAELAEARIKELEAQLRQRGLESN
mgnify:CR=1 FL=1